MKEEKNGEGRKRRRTGMEWKGLNSRKGEDSGKGRNKEKVK